MVDTQDIKEKIDSLDFIHIKLTEASNCIIRDFDSEIKTIDLYLNEQIYFLSNNFNKINKTDTKQMICYSTCLKNLLTLDTCVELTSRAEYGCSRMLFRTLMENYYIIKTIIIFNRDDLLEKWIQGKDINIRREIFEKYDCDYLQEMKDFWSFLCKSTHASIFSQQIEFKYNDMKEDISINIQLIKLMIVLNEYCIKLVLEDKSDINNQLKAKLDNKYKNIIDGFISTWKQI